MIEKKQFTGKLNTDTGAHAMPKEDFTNAQNIRVFSGRSGDMAAVQPVEGNELVDYDLVGEHQCVGRCEDRANNRVFYFLYALNGNHKILVYDGATITKLIHDIDISRSLNFQKNNFIDAQVAGGVLYFTDGINEPRKLEVDAILVGDYTVLDVEELSLFARPGILPISVVKIDSIDSGLRTRPATNSMIDDAFQFAYRFIYEDNSRSVLSPYSKLANRENETDVNNDAARLTLPVDQPIPPRTKRVEFLYRQGNTGSWFIFDSEDRQLNIDAHNSGSPLTRIFYNDKIGTPVSDEVSTKPFDLIPRTAKTLDVAKDRLFLGNLTQGYNKYSVPDLSATAVAAEGSESGDPIIGDFYGAFWIRTDQSNRTDYYILIRIQDGESYDGFYLVNTFEGVTGSQIGDVYDFPDTVTVSEDAKVISGDDFDTLLDSNSFDNSVLIALEQYLGIFNGGNAPTSAEGVRNFGTTARVLGFGDQVTIEGQHFKCAGRYKVGIVFYDKYGRNSGVYTNDDLVVETDDRTYDQFGFTRSIRWSVSDNANIPVWADYYSIVRTKNLNTDFFIQAISGLITYAEVQDDGTYNFSTSFDKDDTSNLAVSIQSLVKDGIGYSYKEGDLIRLWTSDGEIDVSLRVEGQYGKYILCEAYEMGDLTGATSRNTGLIEIYSPTGFNELFYEVGAIYPVANEGQPNRSYSVTTGSLDGDCYSKLRSTSLSVSVSVEAMSINDRKWEFWDQDIGRTNIVIPEAAEERLPNVLRYSNAYIQSTEQNGLSSFDLLDRQDIDEQSGPIRKLLYTSSTNNSSNVLLAICSNNTASIYIGQTQVIDDAGEAILATSGNVIGTVNILRGDYGTTNPESVVLNNGQAYWFDRNLRKVCRYSSNGLFELSQNGIQELMENTKKSSWMPAAFDNKHGEYLLTINTNIGQRLTPLNDFYEGAVGGINFGYVGVIDDDVILQNKSSAGYHSIGNIYTGRTYEVKVAASSGIVPIRVGGEVVATLRDGETFDFYADATKLVEASISSGQAAWVMEKKRSWYDAWDHKSKVLVYSAMTEGFVGTRSFVPDMMSSLNDDFVSWKGGQLYKHGGFINTFFGVRSPSFMSVIFNEYQPLPQIVRGVYIECDKRPYIQVRTELPYVQSTDVIGAEFRRYDGVYYAEIRRDRLTPNLTYIGGLNRGDVVRGQFVRMYIQFTSYPFTLRFVNLEIQKDRGHRLTN